MWFQTTGVVLTAGVGVGSTEIVAFDAALRDAAIADFNLIRVTSIVPPNAPVYRLRRGIVPIDGNGLMLPTVYSMSTRSEPGIVSAAVGVGVPEDETRSGVIFPSEGKDIDSETCVKSLKGMIEEAMQQLRRTDNFHIEHAVASGLCSDEGNWICAIGALAFVDEHLWAYFKDRVELINPRGPL